AEVHDAQGRPDDDRGHHPSIEPMLVHASSKIREASGDRLRIESRAARAAQSRGTALPSSTSSLARTQCGRGTVTGMRVAESCSGANLMESLARLSGLDQSFLHFETPSAYMHVALTAVFDPGSLSVEDGGIDFASIRGHVASRLHLIPRY